MKQIILPVMLSILMQNNIWSQGGFTIPGTVISGSTSPTACCDAWFEAKAPGRHTELDVKCVEPNYNNSDKNHWAQRVDYDLELAFQYTMLMDNPVFPIVQLSTQNAFHSQI